MKVKGRGLDLGPEKGIHPNPGIFWSTSWLARMEKPKETTCCRVKVGREAQKAKRGRVCLCGLRPAERAARDGKPQAKIER